MVRTYVKKTNRGETSETILKNAAISVIRKEKSIRQAALEFNIRKSTLFDRIKAIKQKYGDSYDDSGNEEEEETTNIYKNKYVTRQIFTTQEEYELAQYLLFSSKMHYGLTKKTTQKLAYDFGVELKKSMPPSWHCMKQAGDDWMYGFMRRQQHLSLRKPENTSLARATSFNRYNVDVFFTNLQEVQQKYKFAPERIINTDETGISTVLQTPKVIAATGQKQVGQVVSGERGTLVTFCGIVSASGMSIPPIYIFPRQRIRDDYMYGSAPGAVAFGSKTGWMTTELFTSLLKHVKKNINCTKENPILMIMDNHSTHISLEAINYSRENGIILLSLPPHSTHRMQPLDISVYGPFKARCKAAFNDHMSNNPGKTIKIQDIPKITKDPYLQSFTPANITKGFSKAGIWPINSLVFTDDDFLAASITDRPCSSSLPNCEASQSDLPLESSTINKESFDIVTSIINSIVIEVFQKTKSCNEILQGLKPYPKAEARQETRKRKVKACSKIYTCSAEKNRIEAQELDKKRKELARQTKRQIFEVKRISKIQKKKVESSSESSDFEELIKDKKGKSTICEDSDQDSVFDENFDEGDSFQDILDDESIALGDYILVKFATKKTIKYYVGVVQEVTTEDLKPVYEVKFLRKKGDLGFLFPISDDISLINREDIVSKLPQPTNIKGTARQSGFLKFAVNFHNLNIL